MDCRWKKGVGKPHCRSRILLISLESRTMYKFMILYMACQTFTTQWYLWIDILFPWNSCLTIQQVALHVHTHLYIPGLFPAQWLAFECLNSHHGSPLKKILYEYIWSDMKRPFSGVCFVMTVSYISHPLMLLLSCTKLCICELAQSSVMEDACLAPVFPVLFLLTAPVPISPTTAHCLHPESVSNSHLQQHTLSAYDTPSPETFGATASRTYNYSSQWGVTHNFEKL